jgi:phytoene dehydrogenase-like protein
VEKEHKQLAHHNVLLGADYKALFNQIFNDPTLPEVPSFYVHASARTDKVAALE